MSSSKSEIENPKSKMVTATAPGKIILFGEHAVVYGRPAIAVPVFQVQAKAEISRSARNDKDDVEIDAADLRRRYFLRDAREHDPIATIIRLTCAKLGVEPRGFRVRVTSTIPIGGGMGSGAAVSVSIARALGKYFGELDADERGQARMNRNVIASGAKQSPTSLETLAPHASAGVASSRDPSTPLRSAQDALLAMTPADISTLAYEVEKLHHGTPSGIDNTVIAFEQPVYFVKDQPIESFRVGKPFTIAIADTGIAASTKITVGDVRRAWEADREFFEKLFDHVGALVHNARVMIERGETEGIGGLMTANQIALATMGVSSLAIQKLVDAALGVGALGAKLSGGGRGGNVIALVTEVTQDQVVRAMKDAGAKRVMVTEIK